MLLYAATAEGVSVARQRLNIMEKMIEPCGPPPVRSPAAILLETAAKSAAAAGKTSTSS